MNDINKQADDNTPNVKDVGSGDSLARENAFLKDLAHDLAVELYSSQKIEKGSNAARLIKMARAQFPS